MADGWVFIGAYTFGPRRAVLEKHVDTGAFRAALTIKEPRPGSDEELEEGEIDRPISEGEDVRLIIEAGPPDAFERELVERDGFSVKEAALIASDLKASRAQ
jgi:hypothetical protein